MPTTRTALTTVLTAFLAAGLLALSSGTSSADTVPDKNRVADTDAGDPIWL
ncbi:hypothetical protein [Nocardia colli]|uniref:hypothetical protein n=1 Tax=Nocardia colli TaxID=2545717 RepID=UPI00168D5A82|nr:hypothetical protein [Nocardia colli]